MREGGGPGHVWDGGMDGGCGWRRWRVDKLSRRTSDSHFCPAPPSRPSKPCTATVRPPPHQLLLVVLRLLCSAPGAPCLLLIFDTFDFHFFPPPPSSLKFPAVLILSMTFSSSISSPPLSSFCRKNTRSIYSTLLFHLLLTPSLYAPCFECI